VTVAAPSRTDELERLYRRFKALTLGASAALLLGEDARGLAADAAALRVACEAAAHLGEAFARCLTAARALEAVCACAGSGLPGDRELAELRAAHSRLRRAVWAVVPCEYVPCCVSHAHHEGSAR
jgi:hypothetical protein